MLSFTVLTQNYRVPEHQLSSPYKVHSASHANTVNCLKMPKFRCNLRGRKVTATVCTLLVTKGALSSVRYVHFEDSLWSKRSSSPGQSLEVFFDLEFLHLVTVKRSFGKVKRPFPASIER